MYTMKFTEERLEQAIIELLIKEEIPHVNGGTLSRNTEDVLIKAERQAKDVGLNSLLLISNAFSPQVRSISKKMGNISLVTRGELVSMLRQGQIYMDS